MNKKTLIVIIAAVCALVLVLGVFLIDVFFGIGFSGSSMTTTTELIQGD